MKRQYFFSIAVGMFSIFLTGTIARAENPSLQLPITPIAQRFTVADQNGDTGANDCMAAALAMSLQVLPHALSTPQTTDSYALVRQTLRQLSPDISRGIPPQYLSAVTPQLTGGTYGLEMTQVTPSAWEAFLQEELLNNRPVIVHVSDRNSLYNISSEKAISHVIVVTGMDGESIKIADSWDGRPHRIPTAVFERAWGLGYYRFLAFRFVKQPTPSSFGRILKDRVYSQ